MARGKLATFTSDHAPCLEMPRFTRLDLGVWLEARPIPRRSDQELKWLRLCFERTGIPNGNCRPDIFQHLKPSTLGCISPLEFKRKAPKFSEKKTCVLFS